MAGFKCSRCGVEVENHKTYCDSGHFIGFPNVRRAEEMRDDLLRNYQTTVADAAGRNCTDKIQLLENLLNASVATINVSVKVVRNMAFGENYMSYYNALEQGARRSAERQYHAHRRAVDAKIHPGYETEIVNAALSLNGRGLANYGEVTLVLRSETIEDRASVMRENSFLFYERYDLGRRDAVEESGWRSTWPDRGRLGVAHLAAKLSSAIGQDELFAIVMSSGSTRDDDRYMEVHIFNSISRLSLDKVFLATPLTNIDSQTDWQIAVQKLTARGMSIVGQATQ